MNRPPHLGLRHLALNVRALEPMTRFYVDVLGYAVEWQPDAENVYLTSGGDNVALHAGPPPPDDAGAVQGAGPAGALDHLGLLVAKPEDVDAWAAYLESRGVTLDAQPRTHRDGARSLYLRDPDGNRIQIIHLGAKMR